MERLHNPDHVWINSEDFWRRILESQDEDEDDESWDGEDYCSDDNQNLPLPRIDSKLIEGRLTKHDTCIDIDELS